MKFASKKYFFRALFFIAFLTKTFSVSAQLVVDSVPTAAQIIATLQGPGVTVSNLNINCHREAYGTFTATGTSLGITSGLLLTNGFASNAIGPNNYPTIATKCWNVFSTDTNLTNIINYPPPGPSPAVKVVDACIMTFDIVPTCDSIALNFVFGSEEYPTYVGSYNDGFGFWISGPNPSGGSYNNMNIALVPSTTTPVTINNVNNGTTDTGPCTNCAYYVNNIGGLSIEYNGLTVPITGYAHVVPCQTYHVEIGIADAGDCIYDSGVFIANPGFSCVNTPATTKVSPRDTSVCLGQSVPLTASGTGNYTWGPATGLSGTTGSNVTATPTVTTTYTVTGSNTTSCGTTISSDSVTIVVSPSGFTITPINSTICIGDSVELSAAGVATYSWAPSTGLSSSTDSIVYAKPTSTTTYTVTGTTSSGCSANATALVTVNPLPIVIVIPPNPVICIGDSAKLTASGATTYSWSPATGLSSTTGSVVYSKPGTTTSYTVTGSNGSGCSSTASAMVTIAPIPVLTINPSAPSICQGDSVQLTVTGASTYVWIPATGLSSTTDSVLYAKPNTTTSYTVIGTSSLGCPAVATVLVTVYPNPVVTINPSAAIICSGDSATLIASGAKTYNWLPNIGLNSTTGDTIVAFPTVTTTYTVTAIDSNGCKAAPVNVTVQVIPPLSVQINSAFAGVCAGGKDSLKSVVTGGNAPFTYSWTPTTGLSNSTSSKVNATINASTTYTLTVKDACGTATDTLTVGVYPSPVINFTTNKKSGCTPVCIQFIDSSTISSGSIVHWEWHFGNGQTSTSRDTTYCYTTTGSYNIGLQETSDKGCVSTYNGLYTITANPLPVANFSYSPNTTNILQPTISFTDLSVGAVSWQWNFGDPLATESGADTSNLQNPTHTYQDTGRFCITLTVMNADSCFASNEYCLVIQPDWAIYVPNAFTPNGDGSNDVFIAKGFGLDPDGFEMYIFDRWGNLIFNTDNINQGWDGHANHGSKVAQEDVYVWKIIVKDVFGSTHQYIGKVTLVR